MRATEFVASYFDAWNHRDPKAVADHLAVDGIYRDVPENVQRTHDELIISLSGFFSSYRHQYELTGDILENGNTIAFQYRMCPRGKIRSGHLAGIVSGAEFVTLRDGEAMTITDYYDIPGAVRPSQLVDLTSSNASRRKYAKSGLRSEQLLEYKARLEKIMKWEHAYLRSDLTLPGLASAIDCSVNHLSQVINAGFGVSFFDYLNQFRIEHAKGLLSKLNGQGDAVLNIAFTVGFNSNSAFYAAFKKYVGQTPAQFRRSRLKYRH